MEGWGREEVKVGVVRLAMWGGQEEDVWWRDCSIRPLSCLEGRPAGLSVGVGGCMSADLEGLSRPGVWRPG